MQLKDVKNALNNMMDPTMQKLNPDFKPHYNSDKLLTLNLSPLENPKNKTYGVPGFPNQRFLLEI